MRLYRYYLRIATLNFDIFRFRPVESQMRVPEGKIWFMNIEISD